jgi:hypothetical protein
MTRLELVKRMAEAATRPLHDYAQAPAAPPAAQGDDLHQPLEFDARPHLEPQETTDLFVWFEDTSARPHDSRRGIAGLPECLLPWQQHGEPAMRLVDRRYAEGHFHLLAAVRLRCHGRLGERIASLYTAALSVGTVAWIGTGAHYEAAWNETR